MKFLQLLLSLAGVLLSIYGLLCAYLYLNQSQLIFFPVQAGDDTYKQWQDIEYRLPVDDEALQGWQLTRSSPNDSIILYFGGNAEDVVFNLYDASRFDARQLFFTNYRGYGKSTGAVSGDTLYSDALQVFDALVSRHRLDTRQVVVTGRSLGASVAAYVASQRPVAGLIMVTPFDSLASLAGHYYPWFPVHWLLQHRFDNLQHLQNLRNPVLILAAEHDEIIPIGHIDNLVGAAPPDTEKHIIAQANHQDISRFDSYYQAINGFLARLEAAR